MNYKFFYCLFGLINLYNLIDIDNINIIFFLISLAYNFYFITISNEFSVNYLSDFSVYNYFCKLNERI